jgi:hypothetical protein
MSDAAAPGAAPAAAPATNGAAGQQPAGRARLADFTTGMHNAPALPALDPSSITHQGRAPLAANEGQDTGVPPNPYEQQNAQGDALAVDDSIMAEPISQEQYARDYQELKAKWDSPELPEELLGRLGPAMIDGQKYMIPVSEAFKGYQRNCDYSNKLAEVSQVRNETMQMRQGMQNLVNDLGNGETFRRAMRALGPAAVKGFHEAAKLHAIEWNALQQMPPQQRAVYERNQEMEQRLYQMEMQNQRLAMQAQQQQAQQPDRQTMYIANQLAQMAPLAMKRVGLEPSPFAEQIFQTHFANMMETLNGGDLTTDFVTQVMQATKETVDAYVAKSQQQIQQQARQLPPVQKLPGAAPPRGQQGVPERARLSDFNVRNLR